MTPSMGSSGRGDRGPSELISAQRGQSGRRDGVVSGPDWVDFLAEDPSYVLARRSASRSLTRGSLRWRRRTGPGGKKIAFSSRKGHRLRHRPYAKPLPGIRPGEHSRHRRSADAVPLARSGVYQVKTGKPARGNAERLDSAGARILKSAEDDHESRRPLPEHGISSPRIPSVDSAPYRLLELDDHVDREPARIQPSRAAQQAVPKGSSSWE